MSKSQISVTLEDIVKFLLQLALRVNYFQNKNNFSHPFFSQMIKKINISKSREN